MKGKPVFFNVVDLGLRDVGVRNDGRRLAKLGVKALLLVTVLVVAAATVMCAVLVQAGADPAVASGFFVASVAGIVVLVLRMARDLPPAVATMDAEGRNRALPVIVGLMGLCGAGLVLLGGLSGVPIVVLSMLVAAVAWRQRSPVAAAVQQLRAALAPGERVLGDGVAVARGRRGPEAFRVVAATDRRLLVTGGGAVLDLPYAQVAGFGIAFKAGGLSGELSLTTGDGPLELTAFAPANLVSIAQALRAQGVATEHDEAIDRAAQAWEQAMRRGSRPAPMPEAMHTPQFDRGLWLLLALAAFVLYLNPFGVGLGVRRDVLPALPALLIAGAVCGRLAGTRLALRYIAPLNLLVLPAFLFTTVGEAVALMMLVSLAGAAGLGAGAMLRRGTGAPPRAPREGLARTLSGAGLVGLSQLVLAAFGVLVAGAALAGYDPSAVGRELRVDARELAADGRSNLTGGAASIRYSPAPGIRELAADERWSSDPGDGARWELHQGSDVVSLSSYVFEPELDGEAAIGEFVAGKLAEHAKYAGGVVRPETLRAGGRTGYVWEYTDRGGVWHHVAWFPARVHSVRLECLARRPDPPLCTQAARSLRFPG